MKRLFVGIALDQGARKQAVRLSSELREQEPGLQAKWVPGKNLHFTLQFLGSTDLELEVLRSLENLKNAPFRLSLSGLGSFPDERHARVIWAGAAEGRQPLVRLAEDVSALLAPLGFLRTEKSFEPHLTLARLGQPADLRGRLNTKTDIPTFDVEEVLVIESKTTPSGAEYTVLHAIRLTGTSKKS